MTVSEHLLRRLKEIGVSHIFGVPGDFVLGFLNAVLESDVEYVGCCNELNAAYAADGYARIKGAGAFVSTYGAGELSALNGIAGAFAERIPLVVITGAPATTLFKTQPLLHHTLGDFDVPRQIYEKVTVASVRLESAESAPAKIDSVLRTCLAQQRPVYICLPSDLAAMECGMHGPFVFPEPEPGDPRALAEAVSEAAEMLENAKLPVLIGGVALIRFEIQEEFAALLGKTGLPYATMMMAKALLSERHPQFIGLFEGDRSRESVRARVAAADCVLQLGTSLSDFNSGGFTDHFDSAKTISAHLRSVAVRNHIYENVPLRDFVVALTARLGKRESGLPGIQRAAKGCVHRPGRPYALVAHNPLTIGRFFDRVSEFLGEGAIVAAETGVALFSAAETLMPPGATFIAQAFYGSIGYAVGATLGAAVAAPGRQVLLFVGDGSFQVAAQELSTMIRRGLRPVIFLINNDGYTIERVIVDRPYDDIQPWKYHKLPDVFGGGQGFDVHSEGELELALAKAKMAKGLVFIEIHTARMDAPDSMLSAGRAMAASNHLD